MKVFHGLLLKFLILSFLIQFNLVVIAQGFNWIDSLDLIHQSDHDYPIEPGMHSTTPDPTVLMSWRNDRSLYHDYGSFGLSDELLSNQNIFLTYQYNLSKLEAAELGWSITNIKAVSITYKRTFSFAELFH